MRTVDLDFLSQIRKLQCLACGTNQNIEAHHVQTKARLGGDDPWNVIPLCSNHHTQDENAWHRGTERFLRAFPHVVHHLRRLGWEIWKQPDGKLRVSHPAYRSVIGKQNPDYEIGGKDV